jgi:K+/H+ antiporter YhaU regulatory subunit KhtT
LKDIPILLAFAEADLRSHTVASVVALVHEGHLLPNPKSMTVFQAGARVGLIGEPDQIATAAQFLVDTSNCNLVSQPT